MIFGDRKSFVPSTSDQQGAESLLPAGLADLLPPDADKENVLVNVIASHFTAYGYQRVKPPLLEFERSLLRRVGGATEAHTFRLMDPISHGMLGVRADITPQIGRIAQSRLANAPRPLRLCYTGQVLRVHGNQLRPERQFTQAGVELIGSDHVDADAEIVLLAIECLSALHIPGLSVDLTLPSLVPTLTRWLAMAEDRAQALRDALDRKHAAEVKDLAGEHADLFLALLRAAGPAGPALAALEKIEMPDEAAQERHRLAQLVVRLMEAAPHLTITIDPVEHRGYDYEAGLSFALFAKGVKGELGRGGRYIIGENGQKDPATGFTLYIDTVLRATPMIKMKKRLYLPHGTPLDIARQKRLEGWATIAALAPEDKDTPDALPQEAKRLGCDALWQQDKIVAL